MSRELPIRRFLDLSTGHLREETCRDLGTLGGLHPYATDHGWFLYVPTDAGQYAPLHDWPAEILPIMELALKAGCEYVMFDADAPQVDGLPHWDW